MRTCSMPRARRGRSLDASKTSRPASATMRRCSAAEVSGGDCHRSGSAGSAVPYVPMWGPPSKSAPTFTFSYGDAPRGSIMAFQVPGEGDKLSLIPTWISRDMHVPDPPVVANGVVYAIQTGENTVQNPRPAETSALIRPAGPPVPARSHTGRPAWLRAGNDTGRRPRCGRAWRSCRRSRSAPQPASRHAGDQPRPLRL